MSHCPSVLHFKYSEDPHAANQPVVVVLAGGPGLGWRALEPLSLLTENYDVAFVSPPAFEKSSPDTSFDRLVGSVAEVLRKMDRKFILVGHSFGGFFAASVAERFRGESKVAGLIGICSIFTLQGLRALDENYNLKKGLGVLQREREFLNEPSDDSFRRWLAEYGPLFFLPEQHEEGRAAIEGDTACYRTFQSIRSGWNPNDEFELAVKSLSIPKLFIAAEQDVLVTQAAVKNEASELGAEFQVVASAAHFPTLDQPKSVARLIQTFLRDKAKSEVTV